MPATEAVLIIVVAQGMIRTPVAEATQAHKVSAKMMTGIPATKTTPVNVLQQSCRAVPTIAIEQRSGGDRRGRRRADRCVGGGRVDSERTEDDAAQQTATHPRKRSHDSPQG